MEGLIPSDAHDYFEIVCMRRSLIVVLTKDNQEIKGKAITLEIIDRQELLRIKVGDQLCSVVLKDIKRLQSIGNKDPKENFSVEW